VNWWTTHTQIEIGTNAPNVQCNGAVAKVLDQIRAFYAPVRCYDGIMSQQPKRRLEKQIRKLIARLANSDLANAELQYAVVALLDRLRAINDQPSHSKWYLEEQSREVVKFEKLYFKPTTKQ
jgi:hypothetical protein